MTVVSSKEFAVNQDKYFDLALDEQVCVQRERDNILFIITQYKTIHKQPDDDFRRAISADKLLEGIYEDIDKKFICRNK